MIYPPDEEWLTGISSSDFLGGGADGRVN